MFRPIKNLLFPVISVVALTFALVAPEFAVPSAKPTRVTISGKVMVQKLRTKVPPIYPAEAKRKGIQGTVRLHVIITTSGTVTQVQAVTGDPALVHSASDAVKQWTYEPTLLNGQAVEVDTVVEVSYRLKP